MNTRKVVRNASCWVSKSWRSATRCEPTRMNSTLAAGEQHEAAAQRHLEPQHAPPSQLPCDQADERRTGMVLPAISSPGRQWADHQLLEGADLALRAPPPATFSKRTTRDDRPGTAGTL